MLAQRAPLANPPALRRAPTPVRSCRAVRTVRPVVAVRARYNSDRESVNDKLGAAVGDLLAEIAKADAERRQRWKEFESEVEDRARAAFGKAAESNRTTQKQLPENATVPRTTPSPTVPRTTTNTPIAPIASNRQRPQASTAQISQLQETVDDLRAELAIARFELQQYKSSQKI